MLEPLTKPAAIRNRKRVNADIVDGTTPETPVVKKNIKPTPPAVSAAASPRATRDVHHGTNPAASDAQEKLPAHQAKKADAELKRPVVQAEEEALQSQKEAAQGEQAVERRINMGNEVERVSKGGRIRIVIPPGKLRPADSKIASMYAAACSIAVNEVVPILPHWKEYKDRIEIFSAYACHGVISIKPPLLWPKFPKSTTLRLRDRKSPLFG